MHIQNIQAVNEEKVDFTNVGDEFKAKTTTLFENIKAFFRQVQVHQEQASNIRRHSMKTRQQHDILNQLRLEEKHSLGLYSHM
jgi:hypothetical protein